MGEARQAEHDCGELSSAPPATKYVGIEVKRRGTIDAVEQLTRYLHYLNQDPYLPGGTRGILVAQTVAAQAKTLANSRGIKVVEVDYDELRGMQSAELRLF